MGIFGFGGDFGFGQVRIRDFTFFRGITDFIDFDFGARDFKFGAQVRVKFLNLLRTK